MDTSHDSEFERQLRDALAHLYDFAYLQHHPLAAHLVSEMTTGHTRGQELRRILLDAIDALNPGGLVPRRAPERRAYAVLFGLYVEGGTQPEVAASLAVSTRQLRRDRTTAVKELSALLRAQYPGSTASALPDSLRLESQRPAFGREVVNLSDLIQGLLPLLSGMARERGVGLDANLDPDAPSPLANRTLVRQALIGLASQALASSSLLSLTFGASRVACGVSISLNLQYRLPQGRTEASESAAYLAQIRSAETLVAALGGSLRRELIGSAGEVLELHLPVCDETVVLVVDDNEELFALFERYVAGEAIRLVHASGVEPAIAFIRSQRLQAITVDLMMPGRDGWELLQTLHDDPEMAAIPVIVCSVLEETELAASLGARTYLKKPVRQSDLLTALRAALELSSADPAHPATPARSQAPPSR